MDFFELAKILLRRWYIVVPVVVFAVVAASLVAQRIPDEYVAEGSFAVTTTQASVSDQVLAEVARDGSNRAALREKGADAPYTVRVSRGGIIRVEAEASSPDDVVTTVREVLGMLDGHYQDLQADEGIPEERRGVVEVLNRPIGATSKMVQTGPESVERRYTASGSARTVFPGSTRVEDAPPLRTVLLERLRSAGFEETAEARGARTSYEVDQEQKSLFRVTATGSDPRAAVRTFEAVMDAAAQELESVKGIVDLGPSADVAIKPVAVPAEATAESTRQIRAMVAIAGVGLVVAVLLALLVEGLAQRRRRPDVPSGSEGVNGSDGGDRASELVVYIPPGTAAHPGQRKPDGAPAESRR